MSPFPNDEEPMQLSHVLLSTAERSLLYCGQEGHYIGMVPVTLLVSGTHYNQIQFFWIPTSSSPQFWGHRGWSATLPRSTSPQVP